MKKREDEPRSSVHPKLKTAIEKVTAKRARTVIDHILGHGYVTTQELEGLYGYNHPPRAARDVREAGIPLETFRVTGKDGRSIAAYRFGDPDRIEYHKLAGRRVFSKNLKLELYIIAESRCQVCQTKYEARYLQIDHRVPYEVVGDDTSEERPEQFMLLCASCQRSKSWTCEQCDNWQRKKHVAICEGCYWVNVEEHVHVAETPIRRLDVSWVGEEVEIFERLRTSAVRKSMAVAEMVKEIIKRATGYYR